jgi:hypothetical protein
MGRQGGVAAGRSGKKASCSRADIKASADDPPPPKKRHRTQGQAVRETEIAIQNYEREILAGARAERARQRFSQRAASSSFGANGTAARTAGETASEANQDASKDNKPSSMNGVSDAVDLKTGLDLFDETQPQETDSRPGVVKCSECELYFHPHCLTGQPHNNQENEGRKKRM